MICSVLLEWMSEEKGQGAIKKVPSQRDLSEEEHDMGCETSRSDQWLG